MCSADDIRLFRIPQIIHTGCVFHEVQCPENKRLILFTYKQVSRDMYDFNNLTKLRVFILDFFLDLSFEEYMPNDISVKAISFVINIHFIQYIDE